MNLVYSVKMFLRKQSAEMFYKKVHNIFENIFNIDYSKIYLLECLLNKVAWDCNFIEKRLQHSYFSANIANIAYCEEYLEAGPSSFTKKNITWIWL